MNKEIYSDLRGILKMSCSRVTQEYGMEDVVFDIYQESDIYMNGLITPLDIAKFYNSNWKGNEVFVHVPNSKQILDNLDTVPLIIAYDKKYNNILGLSTLKYWNVVNESANPFFPEVGSESFEMTGILTNMQNKFFGYKGIGVKLYEAQILAAYAYNAMYGGRMRLTCEVDCRNKNSIFALRKASENVNSILRLDKQGKELPTSVIAYYITLKEDETLFESPIFVLEVGLNATEIKEAKPTTIEYEKKSNLNVYSSLLWTVTDGKFKLDKNHKVTVNFVENLGEVRYTKFDREACQLKNYQTIITNGTELGEDRKPLTNMEVEEEYMAALKEKEKERPHVLAKII